MLHLRRSKIAVTVGVAVISMGVLVAAASFSRRLREEADEINCRGRLCQLGLALKLYCEDRGTLPPAYIPDKEGRPMHSWRVLLLPYLDEHDIYNQYDFTEPWDGPSNKALAASAGRAAAKRYQCPGASERGFEGTSYLAVVGQETLWPGERPVKPDTLARNSRKVLLVEVKGSSIHWMEPRDISWDDALCTLAARSPHGSKFNVVTADGLVGTLERNSITFRDSEDRLLHQWLRVPLRD